MAALALVEVAADPMAAVRALNRMRAAGFSLRLDGGSLVVSPANRLSAKQRAFIQRHQPALVELLNDAHTLHEALMAGGRAGLDWREGTPADWPDDRLLAADEVLYSEGRMVNRNGRRFLHEGAGVRP